MPGGPTDLCTANNNCCQGSIVDAMLSGDYSMICPLNSADVCSAVCTALHGKMTTYPHSPVTIIAIWWLFLPKRL